MSEKLTIDGFAGLKKLSIDLRKINVFIGPQSTGKSIAAKLLYFSKNLPSDLPEAVFSGAGERDLKRQWQERFSDYFPPSTWGKSAFSVRYECSNEFIAVQKEGGRTRKFDLSWSQGYRSALRELAKLVANWRQEHPQAGTTAGLDRGEVHAELSRLAADRGTPELYFSQVFVPAGRSFFANVQRNIFRILSVDGALDPFLKAFGAVYERRRGFAMRRGPEKRGQTGSPSMQIERLLGELVGATYVVGKDEDTLEFPDGRVVDIAHASSGQQEAIPLATTLRLASHLLPVANGQTLYIEEPEAHLFPITQRKVVELLATVYNARRDGFQFVITTHSPYILTALNNLLQAGRLAKELAGKATALRRLHKVVPKTQILSADDVAAYYFDGKTARSIMTAEGLIEAEEIDSVSDEIAAQFDRILDIGG